MRAILGNIDWPEVAAVRTEHSYRLGKLVGSIFCDMGTLSLFVF